MERSSEVMGRRRPLVNKVQAVDELRDLAAQGTPPFAAALLPAHLRLVRELIRWCGTLAAAREAAGLPDGRPAPATRHEVIHALRQLREVGVDIGPERLHVLGEDALVAAAAQYWPDLHTARVAAGIIKTGRWQPPQGVPKRRRLAPETAFAELRAMADRLGRTPARHEVPVELSRSLVSMFGGWEKGITAAGLPLHKARVNRGRAGN